MKNEKLLLAILVTIGELSTKVRVEGNGLGGATITIKDKVRYDVTFVEDGHFKVRIDDSVDGKWVKEYGCTNTLLAGGIGCVNDDGDFVVKYSDHEKVYKLS